jgi:hypothetical protein
VKSANAGLKFWGRDGNFHAQGTIPENIRRPRVILEIAETQVLDEHDLLDDIQMSNKWMQVDKIIGRFVLLSVFSHTVQDYGDDWTDLLDEELAYCPVEKLKDQLQLLLILNFESINKSGFINKPKKMTPEQASAKNIRDNLVNELMQLAAK